MTGGWHLPGVLSRSCPWHGVPGGVWWRQVMRTFLKRGFGLLLVLLPAFRAR